MFIKLIYEVIVDFLRRLIPLIQLKKVVCIELVEKNIISMAILLDSLNRLEL